MTFGDKLKKLQRCVKNISTNPNFMKIEAAFTPNIPQTNMVHLYFKQSIYSCEIARDEVCSTLGGIKVFSRIREITPTSDKIRYDAGYRCYLEWTMGDANGSLGDELFVRAWSLFSLYLLEEQ